MPRNIVLCLDGTSNKYASANTNVVKLYAMLDRTRIDQLSYYQPGIGTIAPPGIWGKFKQWFVTRLDLAIAWLLSDHVTDAYRFLMRYYQDGDRIFVFGFSRGAYTARVLAGMLHKVGLLTQGNEELIPFAWDMFKRRPRIRTACRRVSRKLSAGRCGFIFSGFGIPSVRSAGPGPRSTSSSPKTIRMSTSFAMRSRSTSGALISCKISGALCPSRSRTGLVSGRALRCRRRLSRGPVRAFRDRAAMDGRQSRSRGPGSRSGHERRQCCRRRTRRLMPLRIAGGAPNELLSGLWWIVEYLPKPLQGPCRQFCDELDASSRPAAARERHMPRSMSRFSNG